MTFRRQASGSDGAKMWLCAAATIIGLLGIGAGPARGQCEAAKLMASDGQYNDRMGRWVDIDGDVAITGAFYEDTKGENAGAAYIYRLDGEIWVQEQKLLAWNGHDHAHFGCAVGVDADRVIVGAEGQDSHVQDTGAAYIRIYQEGSWIHEIELLAPDGDEDDDFGQAVAMYGDVVLIGAPHDDDHGDRSGSAYIYRHDGTMWQFETKLVPPDSVALDHFGYGVALGDDIAIIGAEGDDDVAQQAGSAYIYRYDGSTWAEEAKLLASDGAYDDRFGRYVDIDGDLAIIGAEEHDGNANGSGAAYVFRRQRSEWVQEAKLLASDGAVGDSFGACAIQQDVALVGAYSASGEMEESGVAYLFRYDGVSWTEERKILASDGDVCDWFARGVALDGERAIIGAHGDDEMAQTAGAAYIFDFAEEDCNENGICDGRDILEGTSCDINANDIPDECEDLCTGDVNADGEVDVADLNDLVGMWGPCVPGEPCLADFHCDGAVNVRDLLILLAHWGPCPERLDARR